ncbi:Holliday junction resolvase RecU [Salisediminibacterium selenitireducens]|uniref:Holliday junction resolvase RecU n=1 Tax=Bacillus selenitireducens (strain ATCC 700615 / DSM 15326 / MLS10) TaxID=439292 RepID=D6XUV9_BACIE|nr:Holliday junction resolvase RecU [Salisediminibacterium selenitireducens]ADH99595.1 recombination protein U [[Bacillus] selenitireducens MLS10]
MAIRYPNGKKYSEKRILKTKKNVNKKDSRYSNRGMSLEEEINESNQYYIAHGLANIHKKPTPIQIVNVHYPSRSAAVITEAYFQKASTTDYNGVYKGKYIDFEAKETKNKTSFPLKNFHDHQINHMIDVIKHGGICFSILRFSATGETFLLKAEYILSWYDQNEDRKSIPKSYIEEHGSLLKQGFLPSIDYLKAVDSMIDCQ